MSYFLRNAEKWGDWKQMIADDRTRRDTCELTDLADLAIDIHNRLPDLLISPVEVLFLEEKNKVQQKLYFAFLETSIFV